MEKLVIIDYSDLSVHFYDIDSEANIDEDYLEELGFHTSNCSWMFGEDLTITFHKKILK